MKLQLISVVFVLSSFSAALAAPRYIEIGHVEGGWDWTEINGISGDGKVVVGSSSFDVGFSSGGYVSHDVHPISWSEATGLVVLNNIRTSSYWGAAVNFDGSLILEGDYNRGQHYYRNGVRLPLANYPPFQAATNQNIEVVGVTQGGVFYGAGRGNAEPVALIWRNGVGELYPVPDDRYIPDKISVITDDLQTVYGEARVVREQTRIGFRKVGNGPIERYSSRDIGFGFYALSYDGSVQAGASGGPNGGVRPAIWTKADGVRHFDNPPGYADGRFMAITADGQMAVGFATGQRQVSPGVWEWIRESFIWTKARGYERLRDYMLAVHRTDISAWPANLQVRYLSKDGRVMAGNREVGNVRSDGFVIILGAPKLGDTDGNGCVDDADLTNMILDFGGPGGVGSGMVNTDRNYDGVVDDSDLTELIQNLGRGC